MSETDPWADVEAAYADIAVNKTARVYLADVVESARAAEAAQHQQEIAAKDAMIAQLEENIARQAGYMLAADARLAAVEAERDQKDRQVAAVYADVDRLTNEKQALRAERDRLKAALREQTERACIFDCGAESRCSCPAHYTYHMALTTQGQSTDGETR